MNDQHLVDSITPAKMPGQSSPEALTWGLRVHFAGVDSQDVSDLGAIGKGIQKALEQELGGAVSCEIASIKPFPPRDLIVWVLVTSSNGELDELFCSTNRFKRIFMGLSSLRLIEWNVVKGLYRDYSAVIRHSVRAANAAIVTEGPSWFR